MAEGLILKDKRKLDRRELIYYLAIHEAGSGREIGRMVDIHNEGMMLMGPKSLAGKSTYRIRLTLPKVLAEIENRRDIEFLCECMWSRPGPNKSFFDSGLKFIDPTEEERRIIDRLIEHFAMPS